MTTKTSAEMVAQVGRWEGLRLRPYKCPAGVWTIGFGHTGKDTTEKGFEVTPGVIVPEIDEAMALALLARDMEGAEASVIAFEKETGVELWPCEFDALVSFVYNCGSGNFKSSTLRKVVAGRGRSVEVAAQLMRWNKAAGKVLPGLTKRRAMEAAWFTGGAVLVETLGEKAAEIVQKWVADNGVNV